MNVNVHMTDETLKFYLSFDRYILQYLLSFCGKGEKGTKTRDNGQTDYYIWFTYSKEHEMLPCFTHHYDYT